MGIKLNLFPTKHKEKMPHRKQTESMTRNIVKRTFSWFVSTIIRWAVILGLIYLFREQILNFIITMFYKFL